MIDLFFRPFYGGVLFDRALTTSAKCLKFDFKMLADGRACLPGGEPKRGEPQSGSTSLRPMSPTSTRG